MRELADDGMTMIVVTHEMGFAREVADQVVFMDGGVVVEQGKPRSVIDNPQHARTRSFLQRMRSEHQEHHAHLEHHEDGDGVVPASALAPEPLTPEPVEGGSVDGGPVEPERERLP